MGEMKIIDIKENSVEITRIEDNVYTKKQIEFRDGKTYMRIKKRILIGNS